MTDRTGPGEQPRTQPPQPSAFRLNLEQQKNRAKDLLRAAKTGEAEALARLAGNGAPVAQVKLADAQFTVARELRFASWAKLKAHIEAMERQRAAIERNAPTPDGGVRTLHIRCGHDIQNTLKDAGFIGDFLPYPIPFCLGPVTAGPERHELMARFLTDTFEGLAYERELEGLAHGEELLRRSAEDYERVVIWMEYDNWDQLVLARVLSIYANSKQPRVLELVSVDEFPGGKRFLGVGELPPEALRMLWATRKPVTREQLALGTEVWDALSSDNPTGLAALAGSGTPALPLMAPVLHRHLQQLPWADNGLSFSERLILQILAEGSGTLNHVFLTLTYEREPLLFMGDLGTLAVVDRMLETTEPVIVRTPPQPGERWFRQQLAITDVGLAVLSGERDWHTLNPPPRWVGGMLIRAGLPGWRWDEVRREPVFRQ